MSGCTKQIAVESTSFAPVIFTEGIAQKVAQVITEAGNPNLKLRVRILGGGCKGFQYDIDFDENMQANDQSYVTNGVTFLVDENSARYLSGATIDYVEDIEGERFTIENPNAKTKCGCGTSFDIE